MNAETFYKQMTTNDTSPLVSDRNLRTQRMIWSRIYHWMTYLYPQHYLNQVSKTDA